ncbi:MAG: FeoB-associated Cys-rich membrane protein [Eubacteriaceae bacterium]|jgi:hypothetical protein|nr:FeoB-associated Cys-rich membrane protein [Eubacteriaceae bacterium]
MMLWLSQNAGTLGVLLLLIALVSGVVIHMIRKKKKGQSGCGCGCGTCPMKDHCHNQ